jgi:hypothetical protein
MHTRHQPASADPILTNANLKHLAIVHVSDLGRHEQSCANFAAVLIAPKAM